MIHSSELMPGASKYAKTKQDVDRIYERLEELFLLVDKHKIKGITLKDYYKIQSQI